jgi:soluble lytic murein transglycosylase
MAVCRFLGWDVGDFTYRAELDAKGYNRRKCEPVPPAGSATLKELYQLVKIAMPGHSGRWNYKNRQQPNVAEQFTDGLMRLGVGDHLVGINQVWS